ncbi:MAG TPA: SRPBCC family protein [Terriglobales bacterium]|nr:SRPBCC family protein [Terriglobales bacterium]
MNLEGARNGGGRGSRRGRLAAAEPWASVIAGSALAIYGVSRKSFPGSALAAVGGLLIYHGATAERRQTAVRVERTLTILKPIGEVYRFWRNFENLPRFMTHLESVKVSGDRFSEWTARGPMGAKISWHAEITDERENQYIVWRSLPGSDIENVGSVQFRQAPGDRGTEVTVSIQYNPPAGIVGDALARMFGRAPDQQVREDLRHFKQLMEAGEIPTTEGQPHGRRSMLGKAAAAWGREEIPQRSREQAVPRQVPA